MDEELLEMAKVIARELGAKLGELLGFGIHGIVFVLESEGEVAPHALKVHSAREPYRRERDVYESLLKNDVHAVLGFHVPRLLRCDDERLALEMTIVPTPYVLDFAGAWLDFPPQFSDDVRQERTEKWRAEFGADWPEAEAILAELEEFGIYMLDPSPSNIRFR
jgi:hypothetical protein